MKIAFYDLLEWEKNYLISRSEKFDYPEDLSGGPYEIVSTFISTPIDCCFLEKFPHLKLIQTRSTGFDHIDLAACKELGIAVSNLPQYAQNTVAEFTFALILNLSRKINYNTQAVINQQATSVENLEGFDLYGKTIGIIGTGAIGSRVAQIAQGFNMRVLAYDTKQTEPLTYTSLETLLIESDVITLHLPYTSETHHIINKQTLSLIKSDAILINTARGGLIDQHALLEALNNKQLAGAGLDVLEDEADILSPINQELINHPAATVTSHNAYNSREARIRMLEETLKTVDNFKKGIHIHPVKNS